MDVKEGIARAIGDIVLDSSCGGVDVGNTFSNAGSGAAATGRCGKEPDEESFTYTCGAGDAVDPISFDPSTLHTLLPFENVEKKLEGVRVEDAKKGVGQRQAPGKRRRKQQFQRDKKPRTRSTTSSCLVVRIGFLVRLYHAFQTRDELEDALHPYWTVNEDAYPVGQRMPTWGTARDPEIREEGRRQDEIKRVEEKYGPIRVWDVGGVEDLSYLLAAPTLGDGRTILDDWPARLDDTPRNYDYDYIRPHFRPPYAAMHLRRQQRGRYFNEDISRWHVHGARTMRRMFFGNVGFDRPLGAWDTSTVKDMAYMFAEAIAFDQNLGGWEVSKCTMMRGMFQNAVRFAGRGLRSWNVGNVTNMQKMFAGARQFNEPIGNWDVAKVLELRALFQDAKSFNQPVGDWDVFGSRKRKRKYNDLTTSRGGGTKSKSKAATFRPFASAHARRKNGDKIKALPGGSSYEGRYRTNDFRKEHRLVSYQPPRNPDGSFQTGLAVTHCREDHRGRGQEEDNDKVKDGFKYEIHGDYIGFSLACVFCGAESFDQPLENWDVSDVINMDGLFAGALQFNQPLNRWDVSRLKSAARMFQNAAAFDQPLDRWKTSSLKDVGSMFQGAAAFNQQLGGWDMSRCEGDDLISMFEGARTFNDATIGQWDLRKCTDLTSLFKGCASFNADISSWDVPNLTQAVQMFAGCKRFNRDLGNFGESLGRSRCAAGRPDYRNLSLAEMFRDCVAFNQNLACFQQVSRYTSHFTSMFENCASFEGKGLETWNPSRALCMERMFKNAVSFNADISNWRVGDFTDTVTDPLSGRYNSYFMPSSSSRRALAEMFAGCRSFNQPIGKWRFIYHQRLNARVLDGMFSGCEEFNQDLGGWDVSRVESMAEMFKDCTKFNNGAAARDEVDEKNKAHRADAGGGTEDDIDNSSAPSSVIAPFAAAVSSRPLTWNTSRVVNMNSMFRNAANFNQAIGDWNVSSVTDMGYMFCGATEFNQPLGNWNVGNVRSMERMFRGAVKFDHLVGNWHEGPVSWGVL
eukprot:g1227.t1